MASIVKQIVIERPAEEVWPAFRDFGAIERLVPGLLTECRLDGDARVVTFADGRVARELLVSIDDEARRVVYAEPGGRFTTRNAAMQIIPKGQDSSLFVWTQDLLPDTHAALVGGNMDRAMPVMKRVLESDMASD